MANEVLEQPQVGFGGTDTTPPAAPSLRETLERAVEQSPIGTPTPDRDVRQQDLFAERETPAQRTQRERDASGRFAPRREGAEVPTQEEVQRASEPQQEIPHEEDSAAPSPSIDNAPKSWKAGPREKWAGLDPEIRSEIHRRERESTRAIGDSAPVRKFAQAFQEVIAPHGQRYSNSGLSPLQVVGNLMQADAVLSSAPQAQRAQFMAKMITDYGIDLQMLDSALSGSDPGEEPLAVVEQLVNQKLAPLQEFVQSTKQARENNLRQEYNQQAQHIEQMAQNTTNFPHFATVQLDMADIMEMNSRRGIYLSPEEAYKRAVAMSPDAQAAEQGRAGQQRARNAHDAATRSLGASLSVSGAPAGLKQQVAPDDLRGTIQAAWNALSGR